MHIFLHKTIHDAALTSRRKDKYCNQKSKNFENITFLTIIYKSVTKNPETLCESKTQNTKCEWRKIPIRFTKVKIINILNQHLLCHCIRKSVNLKSK